MTCQATILDGSNNPYVDSKGNNIYDDSDDDEEDAVSGTKSIWDK